jgi:benzylsuccinate CoA-transferase BbsF subunit
VGKRPLEGVKILQLCWAGVGVFTLNFLTHYGAETIRVETSTYPDPVRVFEPFAPTHKLGEPVGLERSVFYSITHSAPEKGILLNLKKPEAVEIFKKLVKWADVVGEGFPAGVMDKIGLDYDNLKKIKEDLIMMRTCGYGHTGPMAAQPGFGSIITAVTMIDTFTGWPDRAPVAPTTYYTDMLTPMYAALAIIAALDNRRRTGKGMYIDHSQMEAGINYMTPLILDYQANGRKFALKGNHSDYAAPYGIYCCKGEDRWVSVAVFTDDEWLSMRKIMGNPEWASDSKYDTVAGRIQNSDELDRQVEAWTRSLTAEQVMATLQGAGVAAGVVSNAKDIDQDPQLNYYNFYRQLDHPYMGKLRYYHPDAFKLSRAEEAIQRPVLLGEHTDQICTEILGLSKSEIDQLRQKGVFE